MVYGTLVQQDLSDMDALEHLFNTYRFDAVMHFAGKIVVSESVEQPLFYYFHNTQLALTLLTMCQKFSVAHFVFSSTAAVYGVPEQLPISEAHPTQPISPYGQSKLMFESMLLDYQRSCSHFSYCALRYFNVAGAAYEAALGQYFSKATHLIKVACQVALGKRSVFSIYGDDYDTDDGTCVRDFIHVQDLAEAHILSLAYLFDGGRSQVMNCGYGHGYSVKQVLDVFRCRLNVDFPIEVVERRLGDPSVLISDASFISSVLDWKPKKDDLLEIVRSAYLFEQQLG